VTGKQPVLPFSGLQVIYPSAKVKGKRGERYRSGHPFSTNSHPKVQKNWVFRFTTRGRIMFYRRFILGAAALMFALAVTVTSVAASTTGTNRLKNAQVVEPINLAILVQDDLTSQLGNELGVTADFIRSLPRGSRVMVGYITAGSLQVRQPFTNDLNRAAQSLRIPISSTAASSFNPYVEVIEALRSFNSNLRGRNAVLLISDGLDVSRGFDVDSAAHSIDLERAIKQANQRSVAVYTFYAPSVGLTSRSMLAASYGQSSLNRLAHDTGGKAFFQGTTGFVTFDSYYARLAQALNEQSTTAS
jgi:hypothetical protein